MPDDAMHSMTDATVTMGGEAASSVDVLEGELEPGTRVGRYLIVERIGAGAMGFVYAAYDSELDRKIAIKILRTAFWRQSGRDRALREAQAMAKLSHPNVVSVYDVGTLGDQLFVAMELVDGTTLKEWLAAAPRTWREVVRVLVSAGRGIAAAHEAGVVHRDVKPDNILVTRSGQARVVDFGVAQDAGEKTDTVAGTPAYMAPEQQRGAATVASDQFSFCVMLSEALTGVRPASRMTGATSASRGGPSRSASARASRTGRSGSASAAAGSAPRPAAVGRAPSRVRRALRRGLNEDPQRRFPSMGALLDQLDVTSHRRVALSAALLLTGLAAGAVAITTTGDEAAQRCGRAAADVEKVWSEKTRATMTDAFSKSGAAYANDTAARLATLLDDRANAWAATRRDVCEATWVKGEQSELLLDARMQCLDRRLNEMTALVALLTDSVDETLVRRAVEATASLESAESCAQLVRSAEAYPEPTDPARRARLDALNKRIDELNVLRAAARNEQGIAAAEAATAEAEALGHAPALAELLFAHGRLLAGAGKAQDAEEALARGLVVAAEARDDEIAVLVGAERLFVLGSSLGRPAEALALVPDLAAALIRADASPAVRARVQRSIGATYMTKGDYQQALVHMQSALALFERARHGVDALTVASTTNNLGIILDKLGRREEGIGYLERSVTTWETTLGAEHPAVAIGLNNVGTAYQEAGRDADALRAYQRALELWERAHGPEHPDVAIALLNVGQMLSKQGDYAVAEAHFRRALAIGEARLGPNHPNVAIALSFVGAALNEQDRFAEALPFHRRAVEVLRDAVEEDSEYMGVAELGLGVALAGRGDVGDARRLLEKATATLAAAGSTYAPEARFALARVLWRAGADRSRALELAETARRDWARGGSGSRQMSEVEGWLAEHR